MDGLEIEQSTHKRPRTGVCGIFEKTSKTRSIRLGSDPAFLVAEAFASLFELIPLTLASDLHAAFSDKFDDRRQFVRVEPNAVLLANVDDHARRLCEIIAVHQLVAIGARDVIHLGELLRGLAAIGEKTDNGRLSLRVGADGFECRGIHPKPVTFGTARQRGLVDLQSLHSLAAPRAFAARGFQIDSNRSRDSSTTLAKSAADKHQLKTSWTANGF